MSWAKLAREYRNTTGYFPILSELGGRGHINYLELFAVYWALAKWGSPLVGRMMVLHVDNTVACYCLTKTRCSVAHFVPLLRAILKLLLKFDIRLMPTYVASSANYLADASLAWNIQ